ncbi:MAG: restriction endonuclease [Candidatus Thermoplasmatota archaeon]
MVEAEVREKDKRANDWFGLPANRDLVRNYLENGDSDLEKFEALLVLKGYLGNREQLQRILDREQKALEIADFASTLELGPDESVDQIVSATAKVFRTDASTKLAQVLQLLAFRSLSVPSDLLRRLETAGKIESLKIYEASLSAPKASKLPIDFMTGSEFEDFVAKYYETMGYKVLKNGGSGDQGADLIANGRGERLAIQVKRWDAPVGNSAVQEVIAAKTFYACSRAVVVVSSSFTKGAISLAERAGVELIGRAELGAMFQE